VEQDCRRSVEVLASSESLVTVGKSSGTSCFASSVCLHSDRKVGYITLMRLNSTVPPPGD